MSAREIIAHAAWRHEATSGSPSSVANARTLEAFADAGPLVRDKWLSSADAILAAMPDMIAPLVWEVRGNYGTNEYVSGLYLISQGAEPDSSSTECAGWVYVRGGSNVLVRPNKGRCDRFDNHNDAQDAANTHHRAAIMAAFNGEAKT
jgi:hypothetical protein